MINDTETTSQDFMKAWIKTLNAIEKRNASTPSDTTVESTAGPFEDYIPEGFYDKDLEEISAMSDAEVHTELDNLGYSELDVKRNISALTSGNIHFLKSDKKESESAEILESELMTEIIKESIGKSFIYSRVEDTTADTLDTIISDETNNTAPLVKENNSKWSFIGASKRFGNALFLRGLAASIIVLVALVLFAVVYVVQASGSGQLAEQMQSSTETLYWESSAPEGASGGSPVGQAVNSMYLIASKNLTLYTTLIGILMGTLLLLLGTLIYQMYLRTIDLKKIDQWRESGFLCERLEFLSASRIKLNNIELELNQGQIENLKKLAHHRIIGKPLRSVDMDDHAVQSIKRLREELGAKFIEKSLVRVLPKEGHWLEIDANSIHGLPPLAAKKVA